MGWLAVMGVIVGLSLAVVTLVLILALAFDRIMKLQYEVEDQRDANHAKCIAHIADVVSKRVVAMALRDYARRWDSIEEKANLQRLAREKYKVGGPPMPTLWLNQQADLLDPPTDDAHAEYNLAGERIV